MRGARDRDPVPAVRPDEIEPVKERILDFFDTPDPVSDPISEKLRDSDLEIAARVTVALEKFIEEKKLDGLAYYYEGPENSETRTVMSNLIVGNSLLTGAGFPMCGESDLKTCFAMLIMERLGIGGSFAEFHPVDFKEGFVLVGHDGPAQCRHCAGTTCFEKPYEVPRQAGFWRGRGVQDQGRPDYDAEYQLYLRRKIQICDRRRPVC
jgi:L-arabinose isomerase